MLLLALALFLLEESLGSSVNVVSDLLESGVADVQWASDDVIFMMTESGVLYRSSDSGRQWARMNNKFSMDGDHDHTKEFIMEKLFISPANPSYIFVQGRYADNFVSTDMGQRYVHSPLQLSDVRLHPTMPDHVLGVGRSPSCPNGTPAKPCYKILHHSSDFGRTWEKNTVNYVVQFDWDPRIGRQGFKESMSVWATAYEPEASKGNQPSGSWDKHVHLYQFNSMNSRQRLLQYGNRFIIEGDFIFVAQVKPDNEEEVTLQVSRDGVHFERAILPVDLKEHTYTVLDGSEGEVLLHVNHRPFSQGSTEGNLYLSDWTGLLYSLSMPSVHRRADGVVDFMKVEGIEGIYIINVQQASSTGSIVDPVVRTSSGTAAPRVAASNAGQKRTITYITFDKGAAWTQLEVPEQEGEGCGNNCHLHLHGPTVQFGPFYSTAAATGIILATGTVGRYLEEKYEASDVNTYLSRDAGLTWKRVATGSHIYDIGAHGGLIVMAKDQVRVREVLYSWDQGTTWRSHPLGLTEPVSVYNIITEPKGEGQQFLLYGVNSDNTGVIVWLDFSQLHERECTGERTPGESASDFEKWSPSDGRLNGKCLLGHQLVYVRRKASAACFNPDSYERHQELNHCPCSRTDFECDYGYESRSDDVCQLMAVPPPHVDFTRWMYGDTCVDRETKGYRKVPGDTCEGGAEWDAVEKPCSSFTFAALSSFAHRSGIVFLFLLLLGAVFGFLCIAQGNKQGSGSGDESRLAQWCAKLSTLTTGGSLQYRPLGPNVAAMDGADEDDLDDLEGSATLIEHGENANGPEDEDGDSMHARGSKKKQQQKKKKESEGPAFTGLPGISTQASLAATSIPSLRAPLDPDEFDQD